MSKQLLGGQDHPLDHGNAPLLAHGTEPWPDGVTSAPASVGFAGPELRALVADQVPWRRADDVDGAAEELSYLDGVWLMIENRKALKANSERMPKARDLAKKAEACFQTAETARKAAETALAAETAARLAAEEELATAQQRIADLITNNK